jgi:hypothetical protein
MPGDEELKLDKRRKELVQNFSFETRPPRVKVPLDDHDFGIRIRVEQFEFKER